MIKSLARLNFIGPSDTHILQAYYKEKSGFFFNQTIRVGVTITSKLIIAGKHGSLTTVTVETVSNNLNEWFC